MNSQNKASKIADENQVIEKILTSSLNIPSLKTTSELRVPGLPNITTVVNVSIAENLIVVDIPKTKISNDASWCAFIDGDAGQLVDENNYGEIFGSSTDGKTVHIKKCLIQEKCWINTPVIFIESKGITAHELLITNQHASPPLHFYESYILSGFDLPNWPEYTSVTTPELSQLIMDRLSLTSSNGDCILRKLDNNYTRLLFLKKSNIEFEHYEYIVGLLPLISFLNGRRVYLVKKESFDQVGNNINEIFLRNLAPKIHPRQYFPLPLRPDHQSQLIYQLSSIFEDLSANYFLWKTNIFLDEAIFHLHSALNSAMESKFSILSICFETFSSSYSRHKSGNLLEASKYLDKNEFNQDLKDILNIFDKTIKPKLHPADYESMRGKLIGINNRAMTSSFKITLSDLNITLTKIEEKILQKRNPAIHDGVLVRDRNRIDWQEILTYEGTILTIINRLILRLLKYENKVIDYAQIGHPERDI